MRHAAILVGVLVFSPAGVVAQTTQPAAIVEKEATVHLGFSLLSGTDRILGVRAGFSVLRRSNLIETILATESEYIKTPNSVLRNYGEGSLRVDFHPRDRWSPFVLTNWRKDPRSGIAQRIDGGLGIKRVLWKTPRTKHSISFAILRQSERHSDPDVPAFSATFASLRLKDWWKIGQNSDFNFTLFYQPRIGGVSQTRLTGLATFENTIWHGFRTRLEVRDDFDTRPVVPGVEENQLALRMSFVYQFGGVGTSATP